MQPRPSRRPAPAEPVAATAEQAQAQAEEDPPQVRVRLIEPATPVADETSSERPWETPTEIALLAFALLATTILAIQILRRRSG